MRRLAYISLVGCCVVFMGAATLINLKTQVIGILPVVNGGTGSINTTAALTPGSTVAVDFSNTAIIYTLTPGQTETLNASNCATGLEKTIQILTSGTSSFTLTFGTNFKSIGTLATGTVTAKTFNVTFLCNGVTAYEKARTAAE